MELKVVYSLLPPQASLTNFILLLYYVMLLFFDFKKKKLENLLKLIYDIAHSCGIVNVESQ